MFETETKEDVQKDLREVRCHVENVNECMEFKYSYIYTTSKPEDGEETKPRAYRRPESRPCEAETESRPRKAWAKRKRRYRGYRGWRRRPLRKRPAIPTERIDFASLTCYNVEILETFVDYREKMLSRRITGLSSKQQKKVSRLIKTARIASFMKYVVAKL
jgi:small subunit ribosomal protein S18